MWPAFAFGRGGALGELRPSQLHPSPPPPPSPPPYDAPASGEDNERSAPDFLLAEACAAARRFRLDAERGQRPQAPPVPDLSSCTLQPQLRRAAAQRP